MVEVIEKLLILKGAAINFVPQKHSEVIAALDYPQISDKLNALRFIKNSIIGNKTKKGLYMFLGVVPKLVAFLLEPNSTSDLKTQAAIVLGSFAYGDDQNIENLVQAGAIPPLLNGLSSDDWKLVEACGRALRAIYQNPSVPREDVFKDKHIASLMRLLTHSSPHLNELAASLVAKCCETKDHQTCFDDKGAVTLLIKYASSSSPRLQESSIDALASLVRENKELAELVMDGKESKVRPMLQRLIHDKRASMCLIAASLYANVYKACPDLNLGQTIKINVLPVLVKLLNEETITIREKSPLVLAYLVSESEEMQQAASEVDVVSKLAQIIQQGVSQDQKILDKSRDRQKESALIALAAVCSLKEDCRKQVIDAKILPQVVKLMEHEDVNIRSAACQLTRSLSRSVKNLRTSLVDAGIAAPLFKLLSDSSVQVQTTASATLCNIVLDFSPMKKTVLESGGAEKLVSLVSSMDGNLRLNAVWALKNLLFQAESDIKASVMKTLQFPNLVALIYDSEIQIQEQALNLLRNLACGKEGDINEVFNGLGERKLVSLLEEKLESSSLDIVLQALYVIVNISTGSASHKSCIMNSERLLKAVYHYMTNERSDIRVATLWCIINLTWPEDSGSQQRVDRLKQLGFEAMLNQLAADQEMDVKDRVKTALQHFQQAHQARPE